MIMKFNSIIRDMFCFENSTAIIAYRKQTTARSLSYIQFSNTSESDKTH